jgi:NAD(P)-dependent dehydrogenase (short-subunit alcohol dehydrogenase family)
VNRNIGRLLATCTSETALGSAFKDVINQAEDVSEIAIPVSEQVVATHITANGRCEKAPQREDGRSIGSDFNPPRSSGRRRGNAAKRRERRDGLLRSRRRIRAALRFATAVADGQNPARRAAARRLSRERSPWIMSSAREFRWPEFSGKVVVVTGGSAGIGRAIVEAFAVEGAKIAVAGRNEGAARLVADAVARDFAAEAIAVPTDVASPAQCDALIAAAVRRFGRVDVLVNNAAWFALIPLLEVSAEDAARMLDTNFHGPLFCGRAFARWAVENGAKGAIVNVSSISGARPAPGCGLYSASKAALNSLTKSMALEWAPRGVRVNGVAPGHVETEGVRSDFASGILDRDRLTSAIPARRLADVADIADAVLFLASDRSRHVVGATLTIDGGEGM